MTIEAAVRILAELAAQNALTLHHNASDEDAKSFHQAIIKIQELFAPPPSMPTKESCAKHVWVRRREGSWCMNCHTARFGVDLSEEERAVLRP